MNCRRSIELLLFCTLGQALGQAAEPLPLPESTPWDVAALKKAPKLSGSTGRQRACPAVRRRKISRQPHPGVRLLRLAQDAWPSGRVKTPGIVLVHGGGGTAFANWAQLWAKRGYAAIAMDLAGCGEGRKRLPDGGPGQSHADKSVPSTSRSKISGRTTPWQT